MTQSAHTFALVDPELSFIVGESPIYERRRGEFPEIEKPRAVFQVQPDGCSCPLLDRWRFEPVEELDPVQLPDEWKRAVLDGCPTLTWKAFLSLLTTTGCRRREILGLMWKQVHLGGALIRLTSHAAALRAWHQSGRLRSA